MTTTLPPKPAEQLLPDRLVTLQALLSVALNNDLPGPSMISMMSNGVLAMTLDSVEAAVAWCNFFGLPHRIHPRTGTAWSDRAFRWQGWAVNIHSHSDGGAC